MKKILYFILALVTFAGCNHSWLDESEHPMPDGVGAKPEFTFEGESTIKVGKLGGEYSAIIKANQPWLVESSDSWITVTSDRTGKGDGSAETVTFTVQKNPGVEPRKGKIRMWITNEDEAFINIEQDPLAMEDLGNDYYVKQGADGDGSSWDKAMSLSAALESAVDADKIHVAAGTYVPESVLPGGSEEGDKTFFVKANIKLIGGYPANAKDGDTPDPEKNKTILSGEEQYYHVMVVGVPESQMFSTEISGFTLTKGKGGSTATIPVNGKKLHKSNGAGLAIVRSKVTFRDCKIIENVAGGHNAGVYIIHSPEVRFYNCAVLNNSGNNGAGLWNSVSTTYMYDCVVSGNIGKGVGAGIYNFYADSKDQGSSIMYLVNTEISGNQSSSSRGGGYYGRESSEGVMINCTVSGNSSKGAAGVALYGKADTPSKLTMISCTVTGNEATSAAGGGVEACPNTTLNVYNTIVSGNTSSVEGAADMLGQDSKVGSLPKETANCIFGDKVYDANGSAAAGKFEYKTMFGPAKDGVFPLVGEGNPALTSGMDVTALKAIQSGISIPLNVEDVAFDQKRSERNGKVMGAYIGK